ncbi:hypothetical protein GCM10023177_47890 [Streptomyces violaceoruber]
MVGVTIAPQLTGLLTASSPAVLLIARMPVELVYVPEALPVTVNLQAPAVTLALTLPT